MLQDLTRSIAILTDHQRVTEARLDALTRDPTGPNSPNSNPTNPTANTQARVPLIALPPLMAPANIDPPQVPLAQDPVAAWLHPEHQHPHEAYPDGPYAGQDTYNMGQYAEFIVDQAKENEAITMLKEQMEALNQKVAEKADDISPICKTCLYTRMPIYRLVSNSPTSRSSPETPHCRHPNLRLHNITCHIYSNIHA